MEVKSLEEGWGIWGGMLTKHGLGGDIGTKWACRACPIASFRLGKPPGLNGGAAEQLLVGLTTFLRIRTSSSRCSLQLARWLLPQWTRLTYSLLGVCRQVRFTTCDRRLDDGNALYHFFGSSTFIPVRATTSSLITWSLCGAESKSTKNKGSVVFVARCRALTTFLTWNGFPSESRFMISTTNVGCRLRKTILYALTDLIRHVWYLIFRSLMALLSFQ